jgi:hypothetical protein
MNIDNKHRAATDFANAEYRLQTAYAEYREAKKRFDNAQAERDRLQTLLVDVCCVGLLTPDNLFRIDSTRNVLLGYRDGRVTARIIKTEPAS